MPHNIVNGFCESGCKVPVKPAKQVEDLQHGGTGVSVDTVAELAKALGLMPVYTGPADIYVDPNATDEQVATGAYFRTFQGALDVLSYKAILSTVTVRLAAGMIETGTWNLTGAQINCDEWLNFMGNDTAELHGSMTIKGCCGTINFQTMRWVVPSRTGTGNMEFLCRPGILVNGGGIYFRMYDCTFRGETATSTGNIGVTVESGAKCFSSDCFYYDMAFAAYVNECSIAVFIRNKGNCRLSFEASMAVINDYAPCDQKTFTYNNVGASVMSNDVVVNQGNP